MIPVDRGRGAQALADMTERARAALARGRQIVIFPEGTRRAPGAEPSYKYGIVHLYGETGMPCLPIALNSGLFWPRRSFLRYPGTIVAEILDPIPPGPRARTEFAARLQQDIETATARLIAEGERELATQRHRARRGRAQLRLTPLRDVRLVHALEPLRQQMQLGLAVAELLQRRHRRDHVVAVVAGLPVALAHVMQLLVERQPAGILRMAAVDHVAERRHLPFRDWS